LKATTTVWFPLLTMTDGEELPQTVHSVSDVLYACDVKNAKLLQNFLTLSKRFNHR